MKYSPQYFKLSTLAPYLLALLVISAIIIVVGFSTLVEKEELIERLQYQNGKLIEEKESLLSRNYELEYLIDEPRRNENKYNEMDASEYLIDKVDSTKPARYPNFYKGN